MNKLFACLPDWIVLFEFNSFLKVEHLNGANKSNEYLQEMLYTLEIEHCEKLHDIEVLDKHLSNYKCLLKQSQVSTELIRFEFLISA